MSSAVIANQSNYDNHEYNNASPPNEKKEEKMEGDFTSRAKRFSRMVEIVRPTDVDQNTYIQKRKNDEIKRVEQLVREEKRQNSETFRNNIKGKLAPGKADKLYERITASAQILRKLSNGTVAVEVTDETHQFTNLGVVLKSLSLAHPVDLLNALTRFEFSKDEKGELFSSSCALPFAFGDLKLHAAIIDPPDFKPSDYFYRGFNQEGQRVLEPVNDDFAHLQNFNICNILRTSYDKTRMLDSKKAQIIHRMFRKSIVQRVSSVPEMILTALLGYTCNSCLQKWNSDTDKMTNGAVVCGASSHVSSDTSSDDDDHVCFTRSPLCMFLIHILSHFENIPFFFSGGITVSPGIKKMSSMIPMIITALCELITIAAMGDMNYSLEYYITKVINVRASVSLIGETFNIRDHYMVFRELLAERVNFKKFRVSQRKIHGVEEGGKRIAIVPTEVKKDALEKIREECPELLMLLSRKFDNEAGRWLMSVIKIFHTLPIYVHSSLFFFRFKSAAMKPGVSQPLVMPLKKIIHEGFEFVVEHRYDDPYLQRMCDKRDELLSSEYFINRNLEAAFLDAQTTKSSGVLPNNLRIFGLSREKERQLLEEYPARTVSIFKKVSASRIGDTVSSIATSLNSFSSLIDSMHDDIKAVIRAQIARRPRPVIAVGTATQLGAFLIHKMVTTSIKSNPINRSGKTRDDVMDSELMLEISSETPLMSSIDVSGMDATTTTAQRIFLTEGVFKKLALEVIGMPAYFLSSIQGGYNFKDVEAQNYSETLQTWRDGVEKLTIPQVVLLGIMLSRGAQPYYDDPVQNITAPLNRNLFASGLFYTSDNHTFFTVCLLETLCDLISNGVQPVQHEILDKYKGRPRLLAGAMGDDLAIGVQPPTGVDIGVENNFAYTKAFIANVADLYERMGYDVTESLSTTTVEFLKQYGLLGAPEAWTQRLSVFNAERDDNANVSFPGKIKEMVEIFRHKSTRAFYPEASTKLLWVTQQIHAGLLLKNLTQGSIEMRSLRDSKQISFAFEFESVLKRKTVQKWFEIVKIDDGYGSALIYPRGYWMQNDVYGVPAPSTIFKLRKHEESKFLERTSYLTMPTYAYITYWSLPFRRPLDEVLRRQVIKVKSIIPQLETYFSGQDLTAIEQLILEGGGFESVSDNVSLDWFIRVLNFVLRSDNSFFSTVYEHIQSIDVDGLVNALFEVVKPMLHHYPGVFLPPEDYYDLEGMMTSGFALGWKIAKIFPSVVVENVAPGQEYIKKLLDQANNVLDTTAANRSRIVHHFLTTKQVKVPKNIAYYSRLGDKLEQVIQSVNKSDDDRIKWIKTTLRNLRDFTLNIDGYKSRSNRRRLEHGILLIQKTHEPITAISDIVINNGFGNCVRQSSIVSDMLDLFGLPHSQDNVNSFADSLEKELKIRIDPGQFVLLVKRMKNAGIREEMLAQILSQLINAPEKLINRGLDLMKTDFFSDDNNVITIDTKVSYYFSYSLEASKRLMVKTAMKGKHNNIVVYAGVMALFMMAPWMFAEEREDGYYLRKVRARKLCVLP